MSALGQKQTFAVHKLMSSLGHKQTYAPQKRMSALLPIATAKADMCQWSCPLYPQKRTHAVQQRMSAGATSIPAALARAQASRDSVPATRTHARELPFHLPFNWLTAPAEWHRHADYFRTIVRPESFVVCSKQRVGAGRCSR